VVLSNLQLVSGHDYYATVKGMFVYLFIYNSIIIYNILIAAYNFVGSMAQATSMAVTVDTSPPIISRVWIGKQLDHSLTSQYNVTISWDPVLDPESGLASIEWAIGRTQHVRFVLGHHFVLF